MRVESWRPADPPGQGNFPGHGREIDDREGANGTGATGDAYPKLLIEGERGTALPVTDHYCCIVLHYYVIYYYYCRINCVMMLLHRPIRWDYIILM